MDLAIGSANFYTPFTGFVEGGGYDDRMIVLNAPDGLSLEVRLARMPSSLSWIPLSLLTIFLVSLFPASIFACSVMPRNLVRPHAAVITEAKQIFWAEIVSTQPVEHVDGARKPVRYKLRVLRVFKGHVGSRMELAGDGDLSGIWDTTFENHASEEFWKKSSGRMGVESDCSMVPPQFITGKRYLIILSDSEDTKQFERVDSEDDRWMKYVVSRTAGGS